ncbi:Uu.00g132120.m01.CDS01 [Anthostomella pinea]|uniref:Uu.00g132120.m01.CDS01 n=1 Tax=Anthostomella pinea TaxID=933095 RepID=A0AAI8YFX5_9PEZI|nr:Uu.00g132120.m01.CDS01 [Anthostomella pinea]
MARIIHLARLRIATQYRRPHRYRNKNKKRAARRNLQIARELTRNTRSSSLRVQVKPVYSRPPRMTTSKSDDFPSTQEREEFDWASVTPPPSAQYAFADAVTSALLKAMPLIASNAVLDSFGATSLWADQETVGPVIEGTLRYDILHSLSDIVASALLEAAPAFRRARTPCQPLHQTATAASSAMLSPVELPERRLPEDQAGLLPRPATAPSTERAPQESTTSKDHRDKRDRCCPECPQLMTRGVWYDHIRTKHIGNTCIWPGCHGVTMANEGDLRLHVRGHHKDALTAAAAAPDDGGDGGDGLYLCTWPGCAKFIASNGRVQKHLYEHQVRARRAKDRVLDDMYVANWEARGLGEADQDNAEGVN